MIYTPRMREDVRSVKIPNDFKIDIVEYDLEPKFIAIRFYESQWRHFNENERMKCIMYLDKIKMILEGYGVLVTLEPVSDIENM
jgi:hypothetical protein